MFRSYVNPTLEQVVDLVLTVPSAITEVHQCLGKCLAALITSIGPELQGEREPQLSSVIQYVIEDTTLFRHVSVLVSYKYF